jgi:hypothetical protein
LPDDVHGFDLWLDVDVTGEEDWLDQRRRRERW